MLANKRKAKHWRTTSAGRLSAGQTHSDHAVRQVRGLTLPYSTNKSPRILPGSMIPLTAARTSRSSSEVCQASRRTWRRSGRSNCGGRDDCHSSSPRPRRSRRSSG